MIEGDSFLNDYLIILKHINSYSYLPSDNFWSVFIEGL